MPNYIGALDQGTTSTRFTMFDFAGQIVSAAQREHSQVYSQPGWVEHDPEEIWRSVKHVMQDALAARDLTTSDFAAIGITNQRETTVVWNRRTGQAVSNAIVWQDTRTSDYVSDLARQGGQDRFRTENRTSAQHLLQQSKDSLDSRSCIWGAGAGGSGRSVVWKYRHVSCLASHGRPKRRD